jgi:hypothetical protein
MPVSKPFIGIVSFGRAEMCPFFSVSLAIILLPPSYCCLPAAYLLPLFIIFNSKPNLRGQEAFAQLR